MPTSLLPLILSTLQRTKLVHQCRRTEMQKENTKCLFCPHFWGSGVILYQEEKVLSTTLTPIALPLCSFPIKYLPRLLSTPNCLHSCVSSPLPGVKSGYSYQIQLCCHWWRLALLPRCLPAAPRPHQVRALPLPLPRARTSVHSSSTFYTWQRFKSCLYSLASQFFGLLKKLHC